MIPEQSGIYKIDLYENIGVNVTYDESGEIQIITTTGNTINLTQCENYTFNYKDAITQGKNDKITHNHQVFFNVYGYNSFDMLNSVNSVFGYFAVLYFNNDDIKLIPSPIFIDQEITYDEATSQTYALTLSSQVPTFSGLVNFADAPIVWILEDGYWGGADTFWTTNGIWNTI